MKFTFLGIIAIIVAGLTFQTLTAQAPADLIKVRGCLVGNGSDQSPWTLHGVVLPAPPAPAGARGAGAGGARGDGGGRGAGGRGDGGGRGGDGRGAPPAAAPAPQLPPPVDLRLMGIDMTPWRNMFVEVEGTLGPRPASGLRELRAETARSAYGDCR